MCGRKNYSKARILIFFWVHTPYCEFARKGDIKEVRPIVENIIKKEKPDLVFLEGDKIFLNMYLTIFSKKVLKGIYGGEWRKKIEFEYDVALEYANEECIRELSRDMKIVNDCWNTQYMSCIVRLKEGDLEKVRERGRNYLKFRYAYNFYREKGIVRRIKELVEEYSNILIMIGAVHLPLWYELEDAGFEVQAYGDVRQFYPKEVSDRLIEYLTIFRKPDYPPSVGILPPSDAICIEERARGTKVKEFWRKVEEEADRKSDVIEKKYDLEILQSILAEFIFQYLCLSEKAMSLRKLLRISFSSAYLIDEEIIRETFKRIREKKRHLKNEELGSIVVQLLKEKGRWKGERILKIK